MKNNIFYCSLCNYKTNRNYNLKRHHNAVHLKNELNKNDDENVNRNDENVNRKNENVNRKNENVNRNDENVNRNDENVNPIEENVFYCKKCNKEYKQKKYLLSHEEKCNGLNNLTCPKCMKIFSSRISKSAHIKRNNCKAKSIIYALKPDIMINDNTIINNYGSERTDYITFDDIIKILTMSGNSIIPKYIELKHFNKDFPENHNIKYEKNNECYVKNNGIWKITNINSLTDKLIYNNSREIHKYYYDKEKEIEEKIKNITIIKEIYKTFNYLDLQINKDLYNVIRHEIKDIIRTTKINI